MAALKTALSVAMIDEQPQPGGQVWRAKSDAMLSAPCTAESQAGDRMRAMLAASGLCHMAATKLWAMERQADGWTLRCLRAGKVETVVARALILAPGARELVQPGLSARVIAAMPLPAMWRTNPKSAQCLPKLWRSRAASMSCSTTQAAPARLRRWPRLI